MKQKRYGVRVREGVEEIIWIDLARNGWWRGMRLPDGVATRGPLAALKGRFDTEEEARNSIKERIASR